MEHFLASSGGRDRGGVSLLAKLRQNRLDSAGWLLRLRGGRVPSENVVKWYGGVVQVAPVSDVKYIVPAFQCSQLRQLLWQSSSPRRCGVTLADCCCGSKDVAASHSHTAVAAAETLRRPFSHCCCGSRDVAASHSQTAVAAAVRAIASYELCLTCCRRH